MPRQPPIARQTTWPVGAAFGGVESRALGARSPSAEPTSSEADAGGAVSVVRLRLAVGVR